MEKKLKIKAVEWKVGRDSGTKYLSVLTDDAPKAWKSVFEQGFIDEIQKNVGKTMGLIIEDSPDGKYSNIRGVVENVDGEGNPIENEEFDKNAVEHVKMGEKANLGSQYAPSWDDKPSFYVSYAKDVCIALMERNPEGTTRDAMALAIDLVKQAREAFS